MALLAAGIQCSAAAKGQALRSPWDGDPVAQTDVPYQCPAPPQFKKSLYAESYYVDASDSIVDPGRKQMFEKATKAPRHLGEWAGVAADAYRTSGSRAAAQCAYALLRAAASAKAWTDMMPTSQASYAQKWLLSSAAMAYLKVRKSGAGTAKQDKAIQKWFGSVARSVEIYVDDRRWDVNSDAWNNHLYWAGLAVAAAGIARNDRGEFRWGLTAYKTGADEIRADGMLPREMMRAGMALHYHLFALDALVMLAELGEANGIDLYAANDGALARLEKLCEAGLQRPEIFDVATGVRQDMAPRIAGMEIGWAVPYAKHHPDAQLAAWIHEAPTTRDWMWGGLPPA